MIQTKLNAKIISKQCTKCKIVKPFDEFHNDSTRTDGKRYICKDCRQKESKIYRENNPEIEKESKKQYRKLNFKKLNENSRRWDRNNPMKLKERKKRWYENNIENAKKISKKYMQTEAGKKTQAKCKAKRKRNMGYVPLNDWFLGCEGHHINNLHVINIPAEMHKGVWHRQGDVKSMFKINELAINFLNEQRNIA